MNREHAFAVFRLNSCATLLPMVWFLSIGTLLFEVSSDHHAYAITINIEHTPEGENPSWDPDGSILTAHVNAAVAIWKNIFQGPEVYEFDYHWDDDIGDTTLGLTTDLGPVDVFIEINPNVFDNNGTRLNWFADPTPSDNSEFSFADTVDTTGQPLFSRRLFYQLASGDQSTYFPGVPPPEELEVMYRGFGSSSFASASGVAGVNANNGIDLLSTVLHEIGHVLGISGDEPGDYNIDPQHVGGTVGVEVLDGSGGHLGGNGNVPGFLMCDSCGAPGRRRLPTATDALVIAEDQGLQFVFLPRVERITDGAWEIADQWIGGRVPDASQDVFIRDFERVTVQATDAEARNLFVEGGTTGSAINVWPTSNLVVDEMLKIDGPTTLNIWSGATLEAGSLRMDPAALLTQANTLVRFNDFSRGPSSATSANFAGSVAIGVYSINPVVFDPDTLTAWNIAEQLTIGDTRNATLLVNEGTWNVGTYVQVGNSGGRLIIQGSGVMNVGANLVVQGGGTGESETVIESGGTLNVAGTVFISNYGKMKYQNSTPAADNKFGVLGGLTSVEQSPIFPFQYYLAHAPGGNLTFEGTASAATSSIITWGGKGSDAPSALTIFKGNSTAGSAAIRNLGGRKGPALPVGSFKAGKGGSTTFEDYSRAGNANISNEAVLDDFFGTGGRTTFADNSDAENVVVDNFGSIYYSSLNSSAGGMTEFLDAASAGWGTYTNYPGYQQSQFAGSGRTSFFDQTTADHATIINEAGDSPQTEYGGETFFRGQSTAGSAHIFNRGPSTAGLSGVTHFFDNASAANAKITLIAGTTDGGHTEFNDNSNAGEAKIIVEGGSGRGGQVFFNDNSSAALANFTIAPNVQHGPTVQFDDQSTAGDARFVLQNNSSAYISFLGHSSAGNAVFDIGRNGHLSFEGTSTAANADITLRTNSFASLSGGGTMPTLGNAHVHLLGAATQSGNESGAALSLTFASAGTSTIVAEGGAVNSAQGARVIVAGGRLESATLIVNGGAPGAFGGVAEFTWGGNGKNATIVANAGGTVFVNSPVSSYGDTEFGSIEGAGTFLVGGQSRLVTGTRNADTTVFGKIIDGQGYGSGARLTKIGTGTLTLAGANTYTGVTTIDGGTLTVNGSLASSTVVNNGGVLKGTGTIGGAVTVNSGGVLSPGSSTGMITVASLAMMPGSRLDVELGTTYDRVRVNGAVSLDGTLNASFVSGITPAAGNSFDLVDWTSKTGSFSTLNLAALPSGLMWNTSQLYAAGVLSVVAVPPGDFNIDGEVSAADYIVWRKGLGTTYNQNDYDAWRAHFGEGVGSGATLPSGELLSTVPEPASLAYVMFCTLLHIGQRFSRSPKRGRNVT